MNIKREPLSDNEDSEETIIVRRTKRPKKCIDWGFLKSSRKKRKKPDESTKDDGISIDLRQETVSTRLQVEQEKLPVDGFQLVKGVQDANFNVGRSYFPFDGRYGVARVDKLEVDRSSESTLSACSDSDYSNEEDRRLFHDHSYAASPPKKKKKILEPKKISEKKLEQGCETEKAPRPTVDIATLAVYRALIDHTYSSITPSSLIDAVMLKHHYICSIQNFEFQEDFSSKTGYVREQPHRDSKTKPESDSRLDPRSHSKKNATFFKKGGRPKKDVSSSQRRKDLPEDPPSELKPVESLAENPKFRRKNESPKRTPRIKLEKRETSPASSKVPTKKMVKLPNKKRNISPTKKAEVDEKLDSSSLSSKPEEQEKKSKKRRRRNQTGWPTKYKPQLNKSKTSVDNTETKNLKSRSPKKNAKIKKAASTFRESSSEDRVWKDIKREKRGAFNSSGGVNVSIEEAVKRRHQTLNESKKRIFPTSPEKKVREKRKVKSVYQRSEDGSSQLNKHEKGPPKRTGKKPKATLKAKLASFIKKESLSSDEGDKISEPDGNSGNKMVSSSGSRSRRIRQKASTSTRNRVSKSFEKSHRKATPSRTRGTKNEDGVPGDDLPDSVLNQRSAVEDVNCEKSVTDPAVECRPSICESPSKTTSEKGRNERKELSNTNDTIPSQIPEAGQSEKVNSNEVVSLQGENATSPHSSSRRSPPPSPVRDPDTRNRSNGSQAIRTASSTKTPVVSPARSKARVSRSAGSLSPSARKSVASTQGKTKGGVSRHSLVGRPSSSRKPVTSTSRRSKNEDSSPATPSTKSSVSTPSRNETEPDGSSSQSTDKTMPEKSRSATPRKSKAGASARSPVSEKNKSGKNAPTSQQSATNAPHTPPLKIKDFKSETEGTDDAVPSGEDLANLDDTAGSLVPNPKARMSLRKRVRHQVVSLFKPRCPSRSKTSMSQPPKLVKIKQEVVDEDHALSGSNTSAPTDTPGDPTHQPQTVPTKTKRRQKRLFWGHRKPRSKETSTVKLSPVKGKSYKKNSDTSSGIFPDNKKDEIVDNPPEVDDEERRAELGLAIIKVETMESDFMLEESYLGESEGPSWGQGSDTVVDGSNFCTSTSNQDRGKSETPLQDSKGNYPKSKAYSLGVDSELKGLTCTEEFNYDNDTSRGDDVMDHKNVRMMEPEVVYPPLETLDYTGWRNTKTIYTTDVSDSESEDACSITEAVGSCRDLSSVDCGGPCFQSPSPTDCEALASIPKEEEEDSLKSRATPVIGCSSNMTCLPETRNVVLVEPDHLKLGNPILKDDSSSSNPEEEYPLTSRVMHVGCSSDTTYPGTIAPVLMELDHPEPAKSTFEDECNSCCNPEPEEDPLILGVVGVIGRHSNDTSQPETETSIHPKTVDTLAEQELDHPKPAKSTFEDECNSCCSPEPEEDPLTLGVVRVGRHSNDTTSQPETESAIHPKTVETLAEQELDHPKPAKSTFDDECNSCCSPEPEEDPLTLGVVGVIGRSSNDTTSQPETRTAIHPKTVETLAEQELDHPKPAKSTFEDECDSCCSPEPEEDPLTLGVVGVIGRRSNDTNQPETITTIHPKTVVTLAEQKHDHPKPAKSTFDDECNLCCSPEPEAEEDPLALGFVRVVGCCSVDTTCQPGTKTAVLVESDQPKPAKPSFEDDMNSSSNPKEDPLTPRVMHVIGCRSSDVTCQSGTKAAVLVEPDQPKPAKPTFEEDMHLFCNERRELEDDPTSTVLLDDQTKWEARIKNRRDQMRKLKQRHRRFRQKWKRLRAKRKFSIMRQAAVARFLPGANIGMGSAAKRSEFDSSSKSAREKYSLHQLSLIQPEVDPLCDRPESLGVADLTKTSADTQTRGKSRRISRVTPSIIRRRPAKEVKKPQMKQNKKAGEPLRVMSMNEVGELRPLLPKLLSPQPCFETPHLEIRKDLIRPVLPECEPPQPCTVNVVRWHVLSPSSDDAQEVQNQEVAEMRPSMTEVKMQKLEEDDTVTGGPNCAHHLAADGIRKLETVRQNPPVFLKAAYTTASETDPNRANHLAVEGIRKLEDVKQHPQVFPKSAYTSATVTDLEGICKMGTVGTRTTTTREKAKRIFLQISDEHAYCRKSWTYDITRNGKAIVGNIRISEGKETYIFNERDDFVSEKRITKKVPLMFKQKPVTVRVPKTHFKDEVRSNCGQGFKPNPSDPYDLSGIVAPLSTPDPDAAMRAAIRSYAPGNRGCCGPQNPNIDKGGKAVSKGVNQDEKETAPYQPPPEIAQLDVLVRKRFKLPCDQVSYNLRKDGRPPFSYQTMAAMAIESDPLMAAKASDIFDFMQKHFQFYRNITSKWWKQNIRSMLASSKILRSDRIGRHVYYSFCKELRLPGDPAIYEMTEEPSQKSDQSEEDEDSQQDHHGGDHDSVNEQKDESPEYNGSYPFGGLFSPRVDLQEPSELDPLVPICSYSDDESDGFPVIVDAVTYTGDQLPPHTEPEEDYQYECDADIKEEPDEGIYCEDPSPDMESTSLSTNGERVYACSYCPAVFDTLQGNLDHSVIHPEVMKPCPLCDFSSPDEVQLLWHVNSAHPD